MDQYFQKALDITRKYADTMRDANNAVKKSRIVEDHAVSREILVKQQLASVSMNEIIEAAAAQGLLRDPLLRKQLKEMSTILNTPFDCF